MKTEDTQAEQITEQFEKDLLEIAHWFGWKELRKIIDRLEEEEKISDAERYQSKY